MILAEITVHDSESLVFVLILIPTNVSPGSVPARRQLKRDAVPTEFSWHQNERTESSRSVRTAKRRRLAEEREEEARLAMETVSHEEVLAADDISPGMFMSVSCTCFAELPTFVPD